MLREIFVLSIPFIIATIILMLVMMGEEKDERKRL